MEKQGKPVDIVCIDAFKHDGKHIVVGQVIEGMEPDLAKELAGNGRARLAKDEDKAAWKAAQAESRKKVPTQPAPGTST